MTCGRGNRLVRVATETHLTVSSRFHGHHNPPHVSGRVVVAYFLGLRYKLWQHVGENHSKDGHKEHQNDAVF